MALELSLGKPYKMCSRLPWWDGVPSLVHVRKSGSCGGPGRPGGGLSCGRGLHGKQDGKMRLLTRSALAADKGLGFLSSESCRARLGWTAPWSAGAESDFDRTLSLVGSGVVWTQGVLCSGPHRPWLACSIRRTWYIIRSGLVSGRVVATLETARCCDFARPGGRCCPCSVAARSCTCALARSVAAHLCEKPSSIRTWLSSKLAPRAPTLEMGGGNDLQARANASLAPQRRSTSPCLLPAAPRLCLSRLQEHFAAAACRPLRARHCCCSAATVGILSRRPRPRPLTQ
ncbi:hypothetical protein BT67DRAFT_63759 [Trichocladium antarcticum]|uniref:Uncharacterized protein n=1 Tax=Trichocladium antarcticum TaxID=1450529 RepID=A0AAN6ZCI0_9PEZI|nr:hypothetical protein BT67DRAFT_63759 [Trichocladium antarcticum]